MNPRLLERGLNGLIPRHKSERGHLLCATRAGFPKLRRAAVSAAIEEDSGIDLKQFQPADG